MAIKTLKPTIKTKRTANKMNDRQKYNNKNNNNNNGRKGNLEIEYAKREISLQCNEISMLSRVSLVKFGNRLRIEIWQHFS